MTKTTAELQRCPFCEAQPGQAVTATAAQADAHRNHKPTTAAPWYVGLNDKPIEEPMPEQPATAACRACAAGDCQTCLNVYDDTIPCDCNHVPTTTAARRITIDLASAEALARVLRDTAAVAAPTDHPVDRGFRAGIESAAQTIERIAKECADGTR